MLYLTQVTKQLDRRNQHEKTNHIHGNFQKNDPRGLWEYGCYKIPADKADKALKKIYGATPDHTKEVSYTYEGNPSEAVTQIYYDNGYYCVQYDTYGQEHIAVIKDYSFSKGICTIDIDWIMPMYYVDEDAREIRYTTKMVVKPILYNGQPWWRIYSSETVETYY